MLRAIWFLVRVAALTAAAVWLVKAPGHVEITWQGYLIETSASFIVVVLLLLLLLWTAVYRMWRAFVSVPKIYRRYQIAIRHEKGYRAVTEGLVAVAAGDGQAAEKFARRAEYMIPGTPLTRLLTAQTSLMNGDAPKARREFASLLEDDSAAFFGVRGLLNETLSQGNYREALDLVRRAEKLQPKRIWVIRTLFDLETRNREWLKAEKTLRKAEKLGIFDSAAATHHRQAIWTALADESATLGKVVEARKYCETAFALDAGFTPAAVRLAKIHDQEGNRGAALKTVKQAFAANPHPALAALWAAYMPAPKKTKSIYDAGRGVYDWMKQITDLKPEHRDSLRALGGAAMQARLWKEARELLQKGMDYKTLARLEREETGNEAKAREWLELAADSPPDARWVCDSCGNASSDWQGLCPRCGVFDRLNWLTPTIDLHEQRQRVAGLDSGFITPPALLK